ncbi:Uncharacterised protein [Serratia fonticola]|nr:hypothetical protein HAP32_00431 [Serratia fonticola]RDL27885.1 hypothetical protein DFO62_101212 [Serratia fonticola]CAI0711027.1 Uncharacterised protein [Serratia fonticola]CAI0740402.1 Uncharacterised protein [Serratia fonticola]
MAIIRSRRNTNRLNSRTKRALFVPCKNPDGSKRQKTLPKQGLDDRLIGESD